MSKTPEEMAEEYADLCVSDAYYAPLKAGFLAGYQAAKDQLADADKVMPQWISVHKRLPEEDTSVLAFINYTVESEPVRRVASGAFRGGLWLTDHEILAHPLVSHWCELPEAPKEEK